MNDGPLARRDGLVVKTVGDEVLVYDLERARAHSLDALAAAIWRQCDGRRPVAALAAAVRAETGAPVTAAAVEYGLAALGRARLLAGERPGLGPTRRQVLAKIGTAAAIPLVLSITAPTAAQAQSGPPLVCSGPILYQRCGLQCGVLLHLRARQHPRCVSASRLIARVLAGAWRAAPPPPDFTAGDLEAAAPLLHKSGAGALAWWRIRGTPLAQTPTGAGFRQAYRLHALEADVHAIKTAGVLQRLDAAGLEALVVKGWAIARHYPEVGLRQYTDLDLVVRPGKMEAARAALASPPALHYPVDLHAGPASLDALDFDELLTRAERVQLAGLELRVLGPEDHLRVLALHALRHGMFRPIWLVDLAVAVEARPAAFDWSRALGPDPRRADWTTCAVALAHRLLGARVEDTPAAARVRTLPRWLVRAVLQAWDRCEGTSHREPIFHALVGRLGSPARLREEARSRWHRPIQATLEVGGPFNGLPRWPFQVAAVARRAPEIGRALRKVTASSTGR